MVFASRTAETKTKQNYLTPAEFLRPFGEVGNLGGYTIRTNEKQQRVKLENFKINFIDSNLLTPDPKMSSKLVEVIFKENKPHLDDEIHEHSRKETKEELL